MSYLFIIISFSFFRAQKKVYMETLLVIYNSFLVLLHIFLFLIWSMRYYKLTVKQGFNS